METRIPKGILCPRARVLLSLILAMCCSGCRKSPLAQEPGTISFSCLNDWHSPSKLGPEAIAEFTRQTGIAVRTLLYGEELAQRRVQHLAWLESHSSAPDVYETDIIELAGIAEHMIDLAPFAGEDAKGFMPPLLENFMVGGRLVAVPNNTDVGLLFYRTDLLRKYGYSGPPRTWEDLGKTVSVIPARERAAGIKDFWGFVWEGAAWEDIRWVISAVALRESWHDHAMG